MLRPEIFDYMHPGEELVLEPFQRLMAERKLVAVPYDGFWKNMDTFKDKMELETMLLRGQAAVAGVAGLRGTGVAVNRTVRRRPSCHVAGRRRLHG